MSKASAKSLGVYVNSWLTMSSQIGAVVSKCIYLWKLLRKLVPLLAIEAVRTVIMATIASRLDYANSMFLGLPNNAVQVVQNEAAFLIYKLPRNSPTMPLLKQLQWLQFKT